jgi:hypothetical protein
MSEMRWAITSVIVFTLIAFVAVGDGFSDVDRGDSPPGNEPSNSPLVEDVSSFAADNWEASAPCPNGALQQQTDDGLSVSLLNSANRVKLTAGLDALTVFSTRRVFPSGMPLFLYPDSPFGLDTNEFDAHARQSYVGGVFSGPELGGFQTGAQILTFFQNHDLSADDYGLLVLRIWRIEE